MIIVLASQQLNLQWSAFNLFILTLMVLCATLIYASINTITASTIFWFIGTGNTILYMGQRFRDFVVYPLDIYARPLRILPMWLIPFGFTSFYPATFFLERTEYKFFVVMLPVVTIAFAILVYLCWRTAINRYESRDHK